MHHFWQGRRVPNKETTLSTISLPLTLQCRVELGREGTGRGEEEEEEEKSSAITLHASLARVLVSVIVGGLGELEHAL